MNQSIIDGRIHYRSTHKIQHINTDHQDNRFRQSYNCAPVEFGFRRQFESSFAEDATHTLLVAARHQQALFGLVGRGVDEVQEAPLMSSGLTIARHTLHRSEEHTSELQSRVELVCRLLLEKKKGNGAANHADTSDELTLAGGGTTKRPR